MKAPVIVSLAIAAVGLALFIAAGIAILAVFGDTEDVLTTFCVAGVVLAFLGFAAATFPWGSTNRPW